MAEMNDHVFYCRSETTYPKQFSDTLEKLSHYVQKTFKSAMDLDSTFSNFTIPSVPIFLKPVNTNYVVKMAIFNEDINEFVRRQHLIKDTAIGLYSVI